MIIFKVHNFIVKLWAEEEAVLSFCESNFCVSPRNIRKATFLGFEWTWLTPMKLDISSGEIWGEGITVIEKSKKKFWKEARTISNNLEML